MNQFTPPPHFLVKPSALYEAAHSIASILSNAGFQALYAGGWVRDLVMGKEGDDIDIATDASPQEILKLFPDAIPVGISFGVVRIIKNSFQFEVASFRSDGTYIDGRHPSSIEIGKDPVKDAERRDFTVNGLFYNPMTGEILDYVGGVQDISNRRVRTIGSPYERFSEDRLRIIRAIRFKNSLGFTIDTDTWEAIKLFADKIADFISPERIWQELEKMRKKGVLGASLIDLYEARILPFLFPEIAALKSEDIEKRCMKITRVEEARFSTALLVGHLFEIGEPKERIGALSRYKLSKSDMNALYTLNRIEEALSSSNTLSDLDIVRLFALPSADEVFELLKQNACPAVQAKIEHSLSLSVERIFWIEQLRTRQMFIGGKDFLAHGFEKGKKIGTLIEQAFIYSLEKRCVDKEEVITAVLRQQA